jgi:dihydroflavonol-4-reductase
MKAFVTGATGFIGRSVVRQLRGRGDEVWALCRDDSGVEELAALGAHIVHGDIRDSASMRTAMAGCDAVFHIAGWYKIGARDSSAGERINVNGTRTVMNLALELKIPHIIYTSTVAVFGDTHAVLADELYRMPGCDFATEYDRTKWRAHYTVVLPLIEAGAPITIVMPGGIYGPGDNSLIGNLMRQFLAGDLPILPGPETMLTFAHVDDIARGHILAADKGRIGESYILAGPALSLEAIIRMWAEISGRRPPLFGIPAPLVRPLGPLMGLIDKVLPLTGMFSREAIMTLGMSYLGDSSKAKNELGWEARPVVDGMAESVFWTMEHLPPRTRPSAYAILWVFGIFLVILTMVRLLARPQRE